MPNYLVNAVDPKELHKIALNALWFTSSENDKVSLSKAIVSKDSREIEKQTRKALRSVKNPKVRNKLLKHLDR